MKAAVRSLWLYVPRITVRSIGDGTFIIRFSRGKPRSVVLSLADESEAYQAMLETARIHPDDEHVQEDLGKARCAVEVAWLQSTSQRT